MGENLAGCPDLKEGQDVVLPVNTPIKETGHIQILYGNLAPEGSVAKITGKEGLKFRGQVWETNRPMQTTCMCSSLWQVGWRWLGSFVLVPWLQEPSHSPIAVLICPAAGTGCPFSGPML